MPDDSSVAQDDLAAILRLLGLGDHARPQSPHQVVQDEVLPTLRAWRVALEASGMAVPVEPGRYAPAPGERWRVGTSEGTDGLTLYRHTADGPERGRLVGMMREPEDAALVVEAVNARLAGEVADADT